MSFSLPRTRAQMARFRPPHLRDINSRATVLRMSCNLSLPSDLHEIVRNWRKRRGWEGETAVATPQWHPAPRIGRAIPCSALAQDPAKYKSDIGGAFTEPTHEVGEPFTAEWNIDAHPIPLAPQ